jgi:hypothetical protein
LFFNQLGGHEAPLSPLATPNTAASGAIGNFSTPPVTVDPFGLLVVAVFGARDDRLSGVRYTLSRLRSTGKESKHGGAAR